MFGYCDEILLEWFLLCFLILYVWLLEEWYDVLVVFGEDGVEVVGVGFYVCGGCLFECFFSISGIVYGWWVMFWV